jgi:hypothetical protein
MLVSPQHPLPYSFLNVIANAFQEDEGYIELQLSLVTHYIMRILTMVNRGSGPMAIEPTTYDFRLQRKAVKDILSKAPDGLDKDELARLAELNGIKDEDFKKVLANLLNSGHVFSDKTGKIHYLRNE